MKENEELIKILKDLISIRSDVDSKNNEKKVGEYIVDYLSETSSLKIVQQYVTSLRNNIVVTNTDNPEIVFVGHMDTVPVNSVGQLLPKIVDGNLYGRGAVDMKCGLAMMLLLAKQIGTKKAKVAFVFTVDEEYSFKGIKEFVKNNEWKPKLVINPESTNLKFLNQCRGCMEVTLELEGVSAHAGRKKEGVNAIEKAIELTQLIEKKLQKYDTRDMTNSVNLASINGGLLINSKVVSRPNVVPNFCKITIELRIANPKLLPKKIEQIVKDSSENIGIQVKKYESGNWYGPMMPKDSDIYNFISSIKDNNLEIQYTDPNTAGYYEVQMLQNTWNCPIIAFGPGPNEKSHQNDEYVNLDTLEKSYGVLKDFLINKEI